MLTNNKVKYDYMDDMPRMLITFMVRSRLEYAVVMWSYLQDKQKKKNTNKLERVLAKWQQ